MVDEMAVDMAHVRRVLADVAALDNVEDAIRHLRIARALLVRAKAPAAAAKVRSALKSADGAARHAWHRRTRSEDGRTMGRRGRAVRRAVR